MARRWKNVIPRADFVRMRYKWRQWCFMNQHATKQLKSGKILILFSASKNQHFIMFYSAVVDAIRITISQTRNKKLRRSLGRMLRSKTHSTLYDFANATTAIQS